MSLVTAALRIADPLPKLESFERYLFIGPHPDDIEIGAGATAAKLSDMGKELCFLICTDGRYGTEQLKQSLSTQELISSRREETTRSAELLGVRQLRFLDLCDGGFYSDEDLLGGIAKAISDFRPDVVFAPDPLSESECHMDHLRVAQAARAVAYFADNAGVMRHYGASSADVKAIAFYMTAKANVYVKCPDYFERQMESLYMHSTQYPRDTQPTKMLKMYLHVKRIDMGLRCLSTAAEGFRLLTKTRMHCVPEG